MSSVEDKMNISEKLPCGHSIIGVEECFNSLKFSRVVFASTRKKKNTDDETLRNEMPGEGVCRRRQRQTNLTGDVLKEEG